MFAKLMALIVVLGLAGSGLLAMRQSRLQAAHELTAARLRLRQHEEHLQRVRAMIAERSSPAAAGSARRSAAAGQARRARRRRTG